MSSKLMNLNDLRELIGEHPPELRLQAGRKLFDYLVDEYIRLLRDFDPDSPDRLISPAMEEFFVCGIDFLSRSGFLLESYALVCMLIFHLSEKSVLKIHENGSIQPLGALIDKEFENV